MGYSTGGSVPLTVPSPQLHRGCLTGEDRAGETVPVVDRRGPEQDGSGGQGRNRPGLTRITASGPLGSQVAQRTAERRPEDAEGARRERRAAAREALGPHCTLS